MTGKNEIFQDEVDQVPPPEEFYDNIEQNNLEGVQHYLNTSYNFNAVRGWGHEAETALTLATKLGHVKVVEMLIAAGCDVNIPCGKWGRTPLMDAAFQGDVTLLKLLVSHGARQNVYDGSCRSALFLAAANGCKAAVEFLCRRGDAADVINVKCRFEPVPQWAREKLNTVSVTSEDIAVLTSQYSGSTPLLKACWRNNISIVKVLLKYGADITAVNDCGDGVLHIAARNGYIDLLNEVLKHQYSRLNVDLQNDAGETTLHVACRSLFTDSYLDIDRSLDDLRNIPKVITTLILSGCNVVSRDTKSKTPLYTLLTGNFTTKDIVNNEGNRLRFQIIQKVLSAAPSLSLSDLPSEQELSTDLVRQGHSGVLSWLVSFLSSTRSLQHLCRQTIRGCLGGGRLQRAGDIIHSPTLLRYVTMV